MKIVLIDDSPINLIVLKTLSAKIGGLDVIGFTDSEDAMEFLVANPAALIVADYSMPKITGTEVIKRVRASRTNGNTPIVMVTGSSEIAVRRRALELGATDFLTKPVQAVEFMARVRDLLGASVSHQPQPSHAGTAI